MDTKDVGDFLSRSLPPVNESLDNLIKSIREEGEPTKEELFPPVVVLLLPKAYYNRKGKRVDVYGTIDPKTKEFNEGFYYYDHTMSLLKQDGRRYSVDDPNDVISRLKDEDLFFTTKPVSDMKWVHPKHWTLDSFFRPCQSDQRRIEQGGYFLNRMGFVVEIPTNTTDPDTLIDTHGNFYDETGAIFKGQVSSFDLTYQIINWDLFSTSDWSEESLIQPFDGSNSSPARFNPLEEDRNAKMELFFGHILNANRLAKELQIPFGFHMDSKDTNSPS